MNKFAIYPELIAKVIKENELDLYLFWVFSKKIDTNGSGIVKVSDIIKIATELLDLKSNHIYKKINLGVGKYWSTFFIKNNQRYTCLFSLKKILSRIQPELPRAKPFLIPYNFFQNNKDVKTIFISFVAGRYDDGRPISLLSLSKNLGLCESTVRNALKNSIIIETKSNFVSIKESFSIQDLIHKKSNQKIVQINGRYQLVEQLPNSYYINCFQRLPIKNRPKELKKLDKNLDNILPKKYIVNDNQVFVNNQLIFDSYNR